MKYPLLLLLLLFILPSVGKNQTPTATIPDFTFFKLDKTAFKKKNVIQNKKTFFIFFDTECDHCQHAIQYINEHNKELKNIFVYLISLDSKEKITNFLNRNGESLPGKKNILILQDVQNEFIRKFTPRKYPSLFLFSPKQKLIMYDDDEKKLPVFFDLIKSSTP